MSPVRECGRASLTAPIKSIRLKKMVHALKLRRFLAAPLVSLSAPKSSASDASCARKAESTASL